MVEVLNISSWTENLTKKTNSIFDFSKSNDHFEWNAYHRRALLGGLEMLFNFHYIGFVTLSLAIVQKEGLKTPSFTTHILWMPNVFTKIHFHIQFLWCEWLVRQIFTTTTTTMVTTSTTITTPTATTPTASWNTRRWFPFLFFARLPDGWLNINPTYLGPNGGYCSYTLIKLDQIRKEGEKERRKKRKKERKKEWKN